jgi:hypothetical protein
VLTPSCQAPMHDLCPCLGSRAEAANTPGCCYTFQ